MNSSMADLGDGARRDGDTAALLRHDATAIDGAAALASVDGVGQRAGHVDGVESFHLVAARSPAAARLNGEDSVSVSTVAVEEVRTGAKSLAVGETEPLVLGGETMVGGGSAGMYSSVFNLSNTILGSGILALPSAMLRCGIVLGVVFVILGPLFGASPRGSAC